MNLEQWWDDRVREQRPAERGYPMIAELATGKPCILPWSAVLGARERHERFDWQRTYDSLIAAWSRQHSLIATRGHQ